jgi:hypothetical protein
MVTVAECQVCHRTVVWIECPTGGWWAHEDHPDGEHDAQVVIGAGDRWAHARKVLLWNVWHRWRIEWWGHRRSVARRKAGIENPFEFDP